MGWRSPAIVAALAVLAASYLVAVVAVEPAELTPGAGKAWLDARPGYVWQFPADHWARPGYRSEWWYFTGHLETTDGSGKRFGYQFTFFRVGLVPVAPELDSAWTVSDLIMGHAALSDLDAERHVFSEVVYRAMPLLGGFGRHPEPQIAWSRGPAGTDSNWELVWNGDAFDFSMRDARQGIAFSLSTRPTKPLIFQGPGGLSTKAAQAGAASQYYSFTRLETAGTVEIDGVSYQVRGTSWMDKEFGSNKLAADQVGWDWYSLQLDDDRELMLYILRDAEGRPDYASGTVVDPTGDARYLQPGEWRLEVIDQWRSPATGAIYPLGWDLVVATAGIAVRVIPEFEAQENVSRLVPGLAYWEGAVRIEDRAGKRLGAGYVELTGYGETRRPTI